jgi:hypothetical protein
VRHWSSKSCCPCLVVAFSPSLHLAAVLKDLSLDKAAPQPRC